ncbi:unnamed protein product [Arctia plantaginis]|uniref:Uncharacterized protein n=1 Tax=Arctia plantaginis TaxID=874455 RepID=A0A8S1AKL1_ARCPL|nr:unnamed protein product [Arctia plantaginis]
MEQYFFINDVTEEKKKIALFITLIGPESYETLKNLVSPEVPSSLSYTKLVEVLKGHYIEKKSAIAARYEFYQYKQKENQSINDFVVQIKRLAANCQFKTFLKEALRDRFVSGLRNDILISKLLSEPDDLSFEKGIQMALAFESAERDTKYIQPDGNIHLVKKPQYRQGSKAQVPHLEQNLKLEGKLECRRCGGAHLTTRCFKKEWICFVCKKPGHLANKCRFKLSMKGNNVKNVEQEKEVNCDNFDSSNIVSQLKVKYKEVFSKDRSSHILNFKAKLKLKDGATPTFHKAYSIPYSKKQEVEAELLNLVKSGIIKKVTHSDWASPIVIVEKSNKNIRVCVDYKVTLNKQLDTDHYPLPLPEDIFSELAGATCFCVLDLSGAYQQLLLDDKSQEYMTINTHLGLFRPTRLQFGVSSGPSVFQSVMDQILQNVSNVRVFIDDIIISGNSSQDCQKNLENVLQRFKQYNVRVNLEKCQFFCKEIKILGHIISSQGIRPLPDKIEAIAKAPPPGSITQLQAYLGLLNYYGKFLPRLADHLAPLHNLLRKDVPFRWTETCNKSFELSKKLVLEHGLLVHYDCMKDLYVTADASQYGWPNYMSDECLKPYFSKRAELVTEQKCVLWGGRVIIPEQLRSKVLGMFHESHQGIVQTKINAPNSTGMSPNEIIFKYKPRTRFELMKPSNVLSKRIVQSANNLMAQVMFKVGDSVWCKNLKEGKGWSKAFIVQCLSPVRYIISVNGVQKHYHVSDLRNCSTVVTNKNSQDFEDNCKETPVYTPVILSPIDTNSSLNKDIEIRQEVLPEINNTLDIERESMLEDQIDPLEKNVCVEEQVSQKSLLSNSNNTELRRSTRICKAPTRLNL